MTVLTTRLKIDVQSPNAKPAGSIDVKRVDATTEADIAMHQAEDEAQAMLDAAKFAPQGAKAPAAALGALPDE